MGKSSHQPVAHLWGNDGYPNQVNHVKSRHPFARDVVPIPMAGQDVRQEVLFYLWCGRSILTWSIMITMEFLGNWTTFVQNVQQCPNDWHLSHKPQAILDHAVSLCAVEPLQQGGRSLSIH